MNMETQATDTASPVTNKPDKKPECPHCQQKTKDLKSAKKLCKSSQSDKEALLRRNNKLHEKLVAVEMQLKIYLDKYAKVCKEKSGFKKALNDLDRIGW